VFPVRYEQYPSRVLNRRQHDVKCPQLYSYINIPSSQTYRYEINMFYQSLTLYDVSRIQGYPIVHCGTLYISLFQVVIGFYKISFSKNL
jgi:hypothetical protein